MESFTLDFALNAPSFILYHAWLTSDAHSKMTGGMAECSQEVGGNFIAWDGYISGKNGDVGLADYYLDEMKKAMISSSTNEQNKGFPYASNMGTAYGSDPYWEGADNEMAVSPGIWYLFAKRGFNPFAVERNKPIPTEDRFW